MTSKASVSALLERVRAATKEDWSIDIELARIAGLFKEVWDDERQTLMAYELDDGHWWTIGSEGQYAFDPEPYTSSLDAIVALIERELGVWDVSLDVCDDGWFCWIEDPQHRDAHGEGVGASRPLALCAAFLSALLSNLDATQRDSSK